MKKTSYHKFSMMISGLVFHSFAQAAVLNQNPVVQILNQMPAMSETIRHNVNFYKNHLKEVAIAFKILSKKEGMTSQKDLRVQHAIYLVRVMNSNLNNPIVSESVKRFLPEAMKDYDEAVQILSQQKLSQKDSMRIYQLAEKSLRETEKIDSELTLNE